MRSVLITGAAGNLGRALASAFAGGGWTLFLTSRSAEKLGELAERLSGEGAQCHAFSADLRREAEVRCLMRFVAERTERLEALVSNAALAWFEPLERTSAAHWEETLAVNVTGPFLVIREALPLLREGRGAVIAISSGAGRRGAPGLSAYCASKFALMGLSQCLAEEVRGSGVRVTTLCPGSMRGGLSDILPPPMLPDPARFLAPDDFAREVEEIASGRGELWMTDADYRSFPGGY